MAVAREQLSEEKKQQFAGLLLLDRLTSEGTRIHSSFLEKGEKHLEPYLDLLEDKGLVDRDEEYYYRTTEKGKELYQKLIQQRLSYVIHFDIYAHVDLNEGRFADKTRDFLGGEQWEDLRVAVAEFKGIDPYQMVFLAMVSDETFFETHDWKFDLAMGTLFKEMEDIVLSQIREEELEYEDEEGSVSGKEVLEDVIQQGALLNQKRYEEQLKREKEAEKYRREHDDDETMPLLEEHPHGYYGGYDPMMTFGAYAASALFIESIWHTPYW